MALPVVRSIPRQVSCRNPSPVPGVQHSCPVRHFQPGFPGQGRSRARHSANWLASRLFGHLQEKVRWYFITSPFYLSWYQYHFFCSPVGDAILYAACSAAPRAESVEKDSLNMDGNSAKSCWTNGLQSDKFTKRSLGLGKNMSGERGERKARTINEQMKGRHYFLAILSYPQYH